MPRLFLLSAIALILGQSAAGALIETPNATLDLGILAQPAFQSTGQPSSSAVTDDLFLRRARFIAGGTVGSQFEFFLETDAPNLGLYSPSAGTKAITPTFILQDFYVEYKNADYFKVDAGLIYVPFLHNGLQGAGTLYSWDYFSNTFNQSTAMGNINGRDTGVQARGLVADRLEYRAGVFQGRRTGSGGNSPRFAGRLQYNFFDAETGYFYSGTYLGAKKIFSIGAGVDLQDDYRGFGADAFLDMPLGSGVVTAQVDVASLDPGTFLSALPKQVFAVGEAGYKLGMFPISPIVRFERRSVTNPTPVANNETRFGGGVAYWFDGHSSNVKLFYTSVHPDTGVDPTAASYSAVNLQWQLFFFR